MRVFNKRAKFDYELLEKVEAGIELQGSEAKAIRLGRVNISQAFAKIIGNQVWLVNAHIPIEGKKEYNPTRSRKLLLHRDQIRTIEAKMKARRLTLVPVSLYTKRSLRPNGRKSRLYKLELALAKAKRKFEKKADIKAHDIERNTLRELRGYKDK
ncbi:MAG: SsrA-binding protein [Patescibacteria group bacterium]